MGMNKENAHATCCMWCAWCRRAGICQYNGTECSTRSGQRVRRQVLLHATSLLPYMTPAPMLCACAYGHA